MKKFRKQQLYITLSYFIPVCILIMVSTFFVLRMHRAAFDNIRDSLAAESTDIRSLTYYERLDGIITDQDWETLSDAQIDAKLTKAGLETIGDPESSIYYLTPQQIEKKLEKEYDNFPLDDKQLYKNQDVVTLDFTETQDGKIQYISLEEYTTIADRLYYDTYRTIIISSLLLTILFAYLAYRLSTKVMKPIIQSYEQQKQFISDASHELRTPVAILQSEVDVLNRIREIKPERQERFLKNVSTSTSQLTHIIQQLLMLNSLEASGVVNKKPLDLAVEVNNIIEQFSESLHKKDLSLSKESLPLQAMIMGEKGFVSQVLSIVMDNAIKYGTPGGSVFVSISETKKNYSIHVTNTAKPIPEEHLDKLFTRLYRASESRHDGGLGLGLSIARKVMDKLEGRITLENTSRGVMVTISFPRV